MIIKITAIGNNPYRDLVAFPVDKSSYRYKKLRESIEETGYWGTILVRRHPGKKGKFQLVFGHYRLEILKDMGIKETDFVLAEDLSEINMYKRMLLENLDYGKITLNDAIEAYYGFIAQIIKAYNDVDQDVSTLPNIIRDNFKTADSLFNDFDEIVSKEITSLINGERWSEIAGNYIKNIYGKKMHDILWLIIKKEVSYEGLSHKKSQDEILKILKNRWELKNNPVTLTQIQEIIDTAVQAAGAVDSSQIPQGIVNDWIEDIQTGQISIPNTHNAIVKFVTKHQDSEEIVDLSKPGFIYIFMMTDTAGESFIKVGFTNRSVETRRKELDIGPFEITEYMKVEVNNGLSYETLIHNSHKKDKVRENREWYKASMLEKMEKHLREIEANHK